MCKIRNQKSKAYVEELKSDKNLQSFVNKLRYWRTKKGFNQIELSLKCNFYQNKIPDIETLYTSCSVKDIYKIAEVLDVPVAVFFIDDETIINQIISEYQYSNSK